MPIMLTGKDGPPTPFRNTEYIPFYYFILKSILSRCGAELNAIPRNPQVLLRNRAACEFVESDLFRLLIIDATAFMVWPYMGFASIWKFTPATTRRGGLPTAWTTGFKS